MKYLWKGSFVDKEDIHIDLHDRGYQFGDGIYEVTHVYNGVLFALDEHIDRLINSAAFIELNLRHTKDEIAAFCRGLVEQNHIENGYIYLQVTRGDGTLRNHGFSMYEEQQPVFCGFAQSSTRSEEKMVKGADAITVEDRRSLMCNVKSLNLLPNCLAKHAAQKKGVSKAIMVRDNIVTEEKSGNIFIVKDGIVLTHPNGGKILPGITKQLIIELLHQHNIPVWEKEFSEEELLHADEVMVTDTNSEIVPVIKVNDIIIGNGARGEITKKIQMLYKSLIEEKCGKL
ncbi:D-amino-acid transaminase [[Clostridium] innocuum]|jgi:D-alanine transaminase|uniref:D-alanine aminotransferase n=2 Tax=Clostridium innocuum TaxID=1522 RepID=N9VAM6_CLOIN|nr:MULTISPECIES: D-amino-acid transaminase [Thomasclavelia]EFR36353.1 D-amino-acid transaminase [Clostridium sp. HGF2]EGX73914.1 D-amino acid aminotransferase [Erysipelotrichaceae bacterium 2_2_44A]EHO24619.1 D-amino-acid transaminase [Erysipelotrichaceae bacterium 21_3]EHO31334.1 D-amino-acid transaminase [Erysipelotrichaceae bacterium 6_1_45]EQJ54476.1 D-amino-acid transaminase [Clostridioides difficile P28]MDB3324921.1 D-amino-acid transaminase [Clostridioides difficile]CDC82203.1 d-amino